MVGVILYLYKDTLKKNRFLNYKIKKFYFMNLMVDISNELNIPLHIYVLDINNRTFDKGVVYAYQTKKLDLTNIKMVRFTSHSEGQSRRDQRRFIIGDYIIREPIREIIVGQVVAKNQVVATGYWPIKDMPELRIHNLYIFS